MYSKILTLIIVAILLSACASGTKRPKELINETFITDIKEDGTKLFVYIANFRPPKLSGGGRGQGQGRGRQPQAARSMSSLRSDIAEFQERIAIEALEKKLKNTLYCRTGYFILNNYNQFGSVEIRAECQESATESDYRLFQ